jgi:hypothetical protein
MRFSRPIVLAFFLAGISFAQDTNFSAGPQYLITTGSPEFLRPIATPSLSLDAPLPSLPAPPQIGPSVTGQPYVSNPELQHQPNLFPIYYGYPEVRVVELTSNVPLRELPVSFNEGGFVNVPSEQWLLQHGYGVTLADAAADSRAHQRPASHVYTNKDVERLHDLQP